MKRTPLLICLLAASASFTSLLNADVIKPNIVVFYVDDLGWQDIQINDLDEPCAYDTPNIVEFSKGAMNFRQAYSPAPNCSPSRAGINTGQHPAKIRFTSVTLDNRKPGRSTERLMDPYLEGQLNPNLFTSADALAANGYQTGHSGKWHIGLTPASYGFQTVNETRGAHRKTSDRTKDFSTDKDKDYPLSKEKYFPFSEKKPDGISYPYDEVTESAIEFMDENKAEPFFLNLCHWMVHWPMVTRNGELLEYYCDKFEQPFPPKAGDMTLPGQQNPYFASMVTTVDWSLGKVMAYLDKTDDPRHPGKKLSETTYVFFSSDNGGAEKRGAEILSDNAPLKYGKSHAEDGGVRVPLLVKGPGIAAESHYDTPVNQLDFFPTFLSLTGAEIEEENFNNLSGLDISPVLHGSASKVVDASGQERDHLFWHFPHGSQMVSAVRSGDFKLYKRYKTDEYELYRLYLDGKRDDIEEVKDLSKNPEYAPVMAKLSKMLNNSLAANNAEKPYLNPFFKGNTTPAATYQKSSFDAKSKQVGLKINTDGPGVKEAFVIYCQDLTATTKKSKHTSPANTEAIPGMRVPATISKEGFHVSASIPKKIKAYCFMLVDTNGYLHYTKEQSAK